MHKIKEARGKTGVFPPGLWVYGDCILPGIRALWLTRFGTGESCPRYAGLSHRPIPCCHVFRGWFEAEGVSATASGATVDDAWREAAYAIAPF